MFEVLSLRLMTIESNLKKEMFDIRKYCKSQTVLD